MLIALREMIPIMLVTANTEVTPKSSPANHNPVLTPNAHKEIDDKAVRGRLTFLKLTNKKTKTITKATSTPFTIVGMISSPSNSSAPPYYNVISVGRLRSILVFTILSTSFRTLPILSPLFSSALTDNVRSPYRR